MPIQQIGDKMESLVLLERLEDGFFSFGNGNASKGEIQIAIRIREGSYYLGDYLYQTSRTEKLVKEICILEEDFNENS